MAVLTAISLAASAAMIAVSQVGAHRTRKKQKAAAHEADMAAQRLVQEQKDAEENARLQAIEETKDRRRAVTQTIFSEESDEYSMNAGSTNLNPTT